MTKCSKTVTEQSFKFYSTYADALEGNDNYFLETIEFEGSVPPNQIESKTMSGNFRLKNFTRSRATGNFIEKIYLRQN